MKHLPVPQHSLCVCPWSDSAGGERDCEHNSAPAMPWFVKVGVTWYSGQRMTCLWGQLTLTAQGLLP